MSASVAGHEVGVSAHQHAHHLHGEGGGSSNHVTRRKQQSVEKEHISRPLGWGLNVGKGSNGKDDHLDILKTPEFPLSEQTDALT